MTGPTAPSTNAVGDPRRPSPGLRARSAAVGLVAAVVVIAGCSGGSGSGPTTGGSAPTTTAADGSASAGPSAAVDTAGLTGVGWKLTGLLSGGTTTAVDPTLNGWVRFAPAADGVQVAFNTTCNRGGGSATVAADQITFGPQRVTLIYCDGPSGTTETAVLALFNGPRTFRLDATAGTLSITSTDGASGLGFTADPGVGTDAFDDGPASSAAGTATSAAG